MASDPVRDEAQEQRQRIEWRGDGPAQFEACWNAAVVLDGDGHCSIIGEQVRGGETDVGRQRIDEIDHREHVTLQGEMIRYGA